MKTIYIVRGWTGEYSSRKITWDVLAFESEAEAIKLAFNAQIEARRAIALEYRSQEQKAFKNKYDPNFQMSYTGTVYGVDAVKLKTRQEEP